MYYTILTLSETTCPFRSVTVLGKTISLDPSCCKGGNPLGVTMHLPHLCLTVLSLAAATQAARKPTSSDAILLSNVKILTLRKDLKTTHNRVSAVPQLVCIGGNAADLYQVDVMRCKNQGADYDDENIQWTCTANLPSEFKLGSTDVICEGFSSSSDPYVLKGSCGVEYRLLLTEAGEEKYGRGAGNVWSGYKGKGYINWPAIIFWSLFITVVGFMVYSAFLKDWLNGTRRQAGGNGFPWGGGDGGGGGWRPGGDDPPPPYTSAPPPQSKASRSSPRAAPAAAQEGWRPGFWTGTLGGAAAGYLAGNRQNQTRNQGWGNTGGYFGNNNGEGSSGWGGARPSASSSSSFSSTRHESSGFGGTSRR